MNSERAKTELGNEHNILSIEKTATAWIDIGGRESPDADLVVRKATHGV